MSRWFETVDEANAEIRRLEAELAAVLRQLKEQRTTLPPVKVAGKHTPGPWETELITERTRGGHRQHWTIVDWSEPEDFGPELSTLVQQFEDGIFE